MILLRSLQRLLYPLPPKWRIRVRVGDMEYDLKYSIGTRKEVILLTADTKRNATWVGVDNVPNK